MKTKSAKEKGSRFERFVAKEITREGLGKAGREAMSGAGFRKGDIASNLPFLLECKNEKQTNFLKNIDQSKSQAEIGNFSKDKWALITRDPRYPEFEKVYMTIDFWEGLKLFKKDSEPRIKAPDMELKWKLERLKNALNAVIKEIKI